jgi:hypothetical protein
MVNKTNLNLADAFTKDLIDKGRLIEAGWVGLRMAAIPQNAPEAQVEFMRQMFFAGAHHLYASIISAIQDREHNEDDLRRMMLIHSELEEFLRQHQVTAKNA